MGAPDTFTALSLLVQTDQSYSVAARLASHMITTEEKP